MTNNIKTHIDISKRIFKEIPELQIIFKKSKIYDEDDFDTPFLLHETFLMESLRDSIIGNIDEKISSKILNYIELLASEMERNHLIRDLVYSSIFSSIIDFNLIKYILKEGGVITKNKLQELLCSSYHLK